MATWTLIKIDSQHGYEASLPGTDVKIRVFGERFANGLQESVARLPLLEGESYFYEVESGRLSPRSSFVKTASSKGILRPGTAVGHGIFYLEGWEQSQYALMLEVASTVISYDTDFRQLLEDLTGRIADIQMQYSSEIALWVKANPKLKSEHSVQRLFFLLGLIRNASFEIAVRHIVEHPIVHLRERHAHQDVRRACRLDRATLVQFSSSSKRIPLPSGHALSSRMSSIPASVHASLREETIDTAENRFIKFALMYFYRELRHYRQRIAEKKEDNLSINVALNEAMQMLERWNSHSFFRAVGELKSFPSASIALQRREGYREVLRKWVQYQLGASLVWEGGEDIYAANQRNMAALYEYWCCLKLVDITKEIFHYEKDALFRELTHEKGLTFGLKAGKTFSLEGSFESSQDATSNHGRFRKLRVRFSYNRTFSPPERSWSLEMRPDYTLAFYPAEMTEEAAEACDLVTYVHFDAKYKAKCLAKMLDDAEVTDGYEEDEARDVKRIDLLKMHSYRDAIRRTGGAYVLYPGNVDGSQNERNEYTEILPGLGAFPLSPSRDSSAQIKEFLVRIAQHLCDRITRWEKYTYEKHAIYAIGPSIYNFIKENANDLISREGDKVTIDEHFVSRFWDITKIVSLNPNPRIFPLAWMYYRSVCILPEVNETSRDFQVNSTLKNLTSEESASKIGTLVYNWEPPVVVIVNKYHGFMTGEEVLNRFPVFKKYPMKLNADRRYHVWNIALLNPSLVHNYVEGPSFFKRYRKQYEENKSKFL